MRGKQIIVKNADDLKKAKAPQDETMGTAKADKKHQSKKKIKLKIVKNRFQMGLIFIN